jgi:succinate dehydrogenase hydrophobic anchor subunit
MTRLADEPRVETTSVDEADPESPERPSTEAAVGADEPPDTDAPGHESTAHAPAARGRRWGMVGGLVSLAYVCWYIVDLVVLDTNPSGFTAAHRVYGNVAFRGLFALVFLAIVFHGLDGLRVTVTDALPRSRRHDVGLRAAVRFATFAVWIPAAVALLWPAIREWFSR